MPEKLRKIFNTGRTYLRLGFVNVLYVFFYRLAIRFRLLQRFMVGTPGDSTLGPLFGVTDIPKPENIPSIPLIKEADALVKGTFRCFSHDSHFYGTPPDWFVNPFNQKRYCPTDQHWSALGDFDSNIGDIKCIWDISRFDWMLVLVRAFRETGEQKYISTVNNWVSDWCAGNPQYKGPNWKCGQEVGIRMLQVLLAAFIAGQLKEPTKALIRFVQEHAARILPTIRYAIAQDNNHGTSEAAALFVAGSWLMSLESDLVDPEQARSWQKQGRKWLENRMAHLVEDDGSFSQYSVNYHRVLLDTICYVEFWRNLFQEPLFSDAFYQKARVATQWLYTFTDKKNGDAPNIGANDGARLFNLSTADYRDYRPSVQLASRLFMQNPAYPPGVYDETLEWLGLSFSDQKNRSLSMNKESILFRDGGYCYLTQGKTGVFVRYPVFRFRPGHADALHVDLWHNGANIIRDAGTYSYNTDEQWMSYFPGTQAHSTVEFDGRDQMVHVSRFLFGNWLQVNDVSAILKTMKGVVWSVGYKDDKGAEHRRELFVSEYKIIIKDQVIGFQQKAVVRWRLIPVQWTLDGCTCASDVATIRVSSTSPDPQVKMHTGYESRYYFKKSPLPVLTIEVNKGCEVITEIELHQTVQ